MSLLFEGGISVLAVFAQGVLSFFSPCVFPLVPLYISYLSGGAQSIDEDGNTVYQKKKVIIHTICFVIGIGAAFFILGIGFTALGQFFQGNRIWFARLSGIIMILFGMYQLGILGKSRALEKERRLPVKWEKWTMNPLTAWILGFTFSFAWTPCVGPTLTGVLLLAGTSESMTAGIVLIGVYVLGFVIPFLFVGVFAGTLLTLIKKRGNIVKYTVKTGAILLILMGVMTITGWMNGATKYLSSTSESNMENEQEDISKSNYENDSGHEEHKNSESVMAPDFVLLDQYGNEHKLSDYRGKTIFLNFWATWCGPCKSEMPDIQKLYEKYGENNGDVIILGIANPQTEERPYNQDVSIEEIKAFLVENGWNYPVVFDESGTTFSQYGITAFPTTFMIDINGNVYGHVSGMLSEEMMESIIIQTIEWAEEGVEDEQ